MDRQPFEMGETEVPIIGKGKKPRVVYFPQGAIAWITRFLRFRSDDFPAVFVTTGIPRRWDLNDISKYLRALKLKIGIDKTLSPHILRHTYCTNLRDNGTDISLIKELAGHQDIQTTAKYYLGVSKQALRDAVQKKLNYDVVTIEDNWKSPSLNLTGNVASVKDGVKIDHCGGEKIDHSLGGPGLDLLDLQGRLERGLRPALRGALYLTTESLENRNCRGS